MGSQKNTTMRIKSDANLSSSSTRSFISSEGDIRDELAETFDTAIELAEFGWFHLLVLLVCGSTFLSVTLVPNVLTYMRDDVGCNLGLSLQDKSTTNHLTYTGMIAGTFICGILADLFGRRTTLVGILLVNSLSSMCTSMVNKSTSFEVCRFFSSFSTAGSMVVAITYLAELHPPRNRGAAIGCMQIFWVVGTIVFQDESWWSADGLTAVQQAAEIAQSRESLRLAGNLVEAMVAYLADVVRRHHSRDQLPPATAVPEDVQLSTQTPGVPLVTQDLPQALPPASPDGSLPDRLNVREPLDTLSQPSPGTSGVRKTNIWVQPSGIWIGRVDKRRATWPIRTTISGSRTIDLTSPSPCADGDSDIDIYDVMRRMMPQYFDLNI